MTCRATEQARAGPATLACSPTLRVPDDALQKQWVLGQPLHLGDDEVSQLQPPALRVALSLLGKEAHVEGVSWGLGWLWPWDPTGPSTRGELRSVVVASSSIWGMAGGRETKAQGRDVVK